MTLLGLKSAKIYCLFFVLFVKRKFDKTKIMKKINLLLFLLSVGFLGISQTTIEVTSPNGGESFQPGQTVTINYTINNGLEFDSPELHYSIDGGLNYAMIALTTALPSSPPLVYTDSYSWTIPGGINSTNCLIQARLHRGGVGFISTDASDNLFTIQPPITSITLISPNGGESFQPGETINVDYICENGQANDDLLFYYSSDNGITYSSIGSHFFSAVPPVSFSGTLVWTIPGGINSTECLIRAEVYRTPGGIGVVAEDTVDNVFTIQPLITGITIISPNGGENFEPGETINVDYVCENCEVNDDIMLYYSIDNGLSYSSIGSDFLNVPPPASYSGALAWTIPGGINSIECLIRAEVYRTPGGVGVVANDTTDIIFTIQPPVTMVTLTSPNGGEVYEAGESIYVHFQFENGEVGDDLIFNYSIDGGTSYTLIGNKGYSSVPASIEIDSILWAIPSGINSTNCLVSCEIIRGTQIGTDTTDNSFTINLPASISESFFKDVSIYPNPFSNSTTLNLNGLKDVSINIYDLSGKIIYSKEAVNTSNYQIDLDVKQGVYFVELSSNKQVSTFKIIRK